MFWGGGLGFFGVGSSFLGARFEGGGVVVVVAVSLVFAVVVVVVAVVAARIRGACMLWFPVCCS